MDDVGAEPPGPAPTSSRNSGGGDAREGRISTDRHMVPWLGLHHARAQLALGAASSLQRRGRTQCRGHGSIAATALLAAGSLSRNRSFPVTMQAELVDIDARAGFATPKPRPQRGLHPTRYLDKAAVHLEGKSQPDDKPGRRDAVRTFLTDSSARLRRAGRPPGRGPALRSQARCAHPTPPADHRRDEGGPEPPRNRLLSPRSCTVLTTGTAPTAEHPAVSTPRQGRLRRHYVMATPPLTRTSDNLFCSAIGTSPRSVQRSPIALLFGVQRGPKPNNALHDAKRRPTRSDARSSSQANPVQDKRPKPTATASRRAPPA